jgi:membrane-associated PAP2 superfamily phosphatase
VVLPDPVVLQLLLALLLQELLKHLAASAAAAVLLHAGGSKLSYTSLLSKPPGSSTRCDCRSAGQQNSRQALPTK